MTPPKSPPQPAVSVEQARVFRIALWNTLRGRGMADQVCYDIINPTMDALPASAAPPADGVPAGFVLVPIKPTQDMCDNATEVLIDDGRGCHTALNWSEAAEVYAAMLSAAPKAPTAPSGEVGDEEGAPCELCSKPVKVGQVVLLYDDVGEVHADCQNPYSLDAEGSDEAPNPCVLIGSPMQLAPVSAVRAALSPSASADREVANAIFDVIWPLQEWNGEEAVCRAASEQAARAALAALGEQGGK